ncbi:MAG: sigma-70 family RNA polymerase sigma factor [Spirochaetes bacterium]|nr:sigma-70 family RNA polymerase sigma factor [Spirochaetota bacterium]
MDQDQFYKQYFPLVKSIVNRYAHLGIPEDDLVQEGYLGIFEARSRFKENKNAKFSTYATYWIKKRILHYIDRELKLSKKVLIKDDLDMIPHHDMDHEKIIQIPADIPEIEKQVLDLFFFQKRTLDEISRILNKRREMVRQIKNKALRRLKFNKNLTEPL